MTREEAIKVASEMYGWLKTDREKEALETIVPELHESEDERIRKQLINICNEWLGGGYNARPCPNDVRWLKNLLEKQKEQKPILEVFGFKVGDAVRLKDGDGRKHIIKSFEEVEGVHGPNFYHVEFEDNSARDGIYPGEEYPNGYYTQMEKFEEEQKHAWSEEDLIHLANAILSAEKEWGAESCTAKWLKSLPERFNLQPKQEWSEEDEEDNIYLLLRMVDAVDSIPYINGTLRVSDEKKKELKEFIKRPSWKPSEERMMEEAVEGSVILRDMYDNRSLDIDFVLPDNLKIGDKVRVIVLPKEDDR